MRGVTKLSNLINVVNRIRHASPYSKPIPGLRNTSGSSTIFTNQAYCVRLASFPPWPKIQQRGLRRKTEPPRLPLPKDEPTEHEKILMQRMLEQRQTNILKVAQERNWFVPSDHLLQHPIGWSSYLWEEWVAGWELVPIVSRSHTELVLEHYFGMAGKFTPIMFQLDPFAPDFVFRYEGRDVSEVQGGAASMEQGSPGAYYYFRMGDDEIFKFSSEYDVYSPEEFVRAAGTTPDSDIPGFGLDSMMGELSVVPALPDSERSTRAFAKDCDRELIQFEERLAALEREGKERPDSIMALGSDGELPLYPLTDEKIQTLRERYQAYKAYGVYSIYTLAIDDEIVKAEEQREKQLKYLQEMKDFEGRVEELKEELHEITDDEGEFEIVKPQSRGRRRRGDKRRQTEEKD